MNGSEISLQMFLTVDGKLQREVSMGLARGGAFSRWDAHKENYCIDIDVAGGRWQDVALDRDRWARLSPGFCQKMSSVRSLAVRVLEG